jgi:hypothetical protein
MPVIPRLEIETDEFKASLDCLVRSVSKGRKKKKKNLSELSLIYKLQKIRVFFAYWIRYFKFLGTQI